MIGASPAQEALLEEGVVPEYASALRTGQAWTALVASTAAFAVCVAAWLMNGVLVTFLDSSGAMELGRVRSAWLIGIPVLTGALLRLPAGMLSDRFGGRRVFALLMLISAGACLATSFARDFTGLLLGGLGFGVVGATFAAGVCYVSTWFPAKRQGTALGVFGAGNAGTALTATLGPALLVRLTQGGALDGWRGLPRIYAALLAVTAVAFWVSTRERRMQSASVLPLAVRLKPLGEARVWRYGLYYFFAYGGFVALSQWLIPYYVNLYALGLATAGFLASFFILPAAGVRVLGGWLADRLSPARVLRWSLALALVLLVALFPPRMDVQTPGPGITASRAGQVTSVAHDRLVVGPDVYPFASTSAGARIAFGPEDAPRPRSLLPRSRLVLEPIVAVGDVVQPGQLLVRGTTHIEFQADVAVMTTLVVLLAVLMGFAAGAVYARIPAAFPGQVGTVGGIVAVLGALGGFFLPIGFGYALDLSGIWTSNWMLLFALVLGALAWMHAPRRGAAKDGGDTVTPEV